MRRAAWSVLATVAVLAFGPSTAFGAGWIGEGFPNPNLIANQVYGVSCATARSCEAVGAGFDAHWNGSIWGQQSDPGGGSFVAVSCPRARFCAAVGSGIAGHWNGVTWSLDPFPISATAVSCSRRTFCLAVGDSAAATWDGTSWTVQAPPVSGLDAVSCRGSACMAVGGTTAERFVGGVWTGAPTAAPPGAAGYSLSGVSCPRAMFCVAVGGQSLAGGTQPLAEAWNGTGWSTMSTPTPPGTPGYPVFAQFAGVSCHTQGFCVATGVQILQGLAPAVFAELWNGTAWRLIPSPFGDGGGLTNGGSVSCPTLTRCQAVGDMASPVSTASFNLAARYVR